MTHCLDAAPGTVHWGYFDRSLSPVLTVRSGDVVDVVTLTHHAGDIPDLMMDDGVRAVYAGVPDRGPGPHILTGPIAVAGARPGDTLEVRVVQLTPRLDVGANLAAPWGYLAERFPADRITAFRIEPDGVAAVAEFSFERPPGPADPGRIVPPASVTRVPALRGVRVPLRLHFGVIGLAPAAPGRVSSVPPRPFGGNVDNWRFGVGARMFYPVQVEGALLSLGDPHAAQGDGELSGTALEASLNGRIQVILHHDCPVRTPVLETDLEWMTHGFGDTLNEAMRDAAEAMLDLLVGRFGLSGADAYALCSVAVDFGVTQVVDQRLGVHAALPKSVLARG